MNKQHLFNQIYRTVGLVPVAWLESPSTSTLSDYQVDLREQEEQEQWEPNNISTLSLHHSINVQFPSLNLITNPQTETAVMPKPYKAEERHPPFPLIQDDDVSQNSGREKAANDMFFTIYKAGCDPTSRNFTNADLFTDVEEAMKCHGSTRLGAVIFRTTESSSMQIRIRRSTKCVWDGESFYTEQDYTTSLQAFLTKRCDARWYLDLVHLLTVTDDRAARHIELRLRLWQYAEEGPPESSELYKKFMASFGLPARHPDYAKFLEGYLTKAKPKTSIFAKPATCGICSHPLSDPKSHKPFSLPCDPKHIIGLPCLETLFLTNDPAKIICPYPHCHNPILTSPSQIQTLRFHLAPTTLFTAWENLEKSHSDLDLALASHDTHSNLTIHSATFLSTWQDFARTSIEPATLTHLNPLFCPETAILQTVLEENISRLEGVNSSLAALAQFLKMKVFAAFRERFWEEGLDKTLLACEMGWLGQCDWLRKMLRPGFVEFAERTLNRTLRWFVVRGCGCVEGIGREKHWHGGREYFNEKFLEMKGEEMGREKREVFMWQRGVKGREFLRGLREIEERERKERPLAGRVE